MHNLNDFKNNLKIFYKTLKIVIKHYYKYNQIFYATI